MRKSGKFHVLALWMIVLFSLVVAQKDQGKSRAETEPINLEVVVKDIAGKRLLDLKKEDFEIYEDGALQEIARFKPAPHPLRLILLFDTSVSMGAIFPAVKDEAVKLVESLNQLDEIIIGAFDSDLQLNANWSGKAVAASEILALKSPESPYILQSRQPSPFPFPRPAPKSKAAPDKETNLFGAMHSLFERFGGPGGNEAVVLISDGKDSLDRNIARERPVKDSKQAVREAQENWTQIYGACFKFDRENGGGGLPIGAGNYGSDCKFLSEIAGATGGRSFEFDSQSAFAQAMKKIVDELKSQYTLAYFPMSKENRVGSHQIKVVVKKPEVVIRARETYIISK